MKGFGLWVLFLVLGTALIFFSLPKVPGRDVSHVQIDMDMTVQIRKLKENLHAQFGHKDNVGSIQLEDYSPTDPVPSSKASVRPGPIQHGTPLMPYIPNPTPPGPTQPNYPGFH